MEQHEQESESPEEQGSFEQGPWKDALGRLGHEEFRPGQREAIELLLERRKLLLVAPTGGGKSLTYQLPATVLEGTTIVISPLVALMADQVRGLLDKGVQATYLASTLDSETMRERLDGLRHGQYDLVYVSPERLAFPGFRARLSEIAVPLIAVDEAHCISEWGHDFRPEYAQIGVFIASIPRARVLACTATATPIVRDEILSKLGLPQSTAQLIRGFARPNIVFRAQETSGKAARERAVDNLLHEALQGPGQAQGCAIVYAPTRKMAEQEQERLGALGWRCGVYHAGLSASKREKTLAAFSRLKLELVVATNAFGMGIDRGDVRAVVHLAPPGSIEAYYQEVGRAGRDGAKAYGLLCISPQDLPRRRRLLEAPVDGRRPPESSIEHKWNLYLELMRWVECGSCRHDAILRYFGDDEEVLGACGICDNCVALQSGKAHAEFDEASTQLIIQKALSGVARAHGRLGLSSVAKLLRGKKDPRLARCGLDRVSTFGVLAEHDEAWIVSLLRRCVTAGWVQLWGDDYPVVALSASGKTVMRGEKKGELCLPDPSRKLSSGSSGRSNKRREPVAALEPEAAARFEALRSLRRRLAQDAEIPPYAVASDRTLRELASVNPRCHADLLDIHGIGANRAERFGAAFLEALSEVQLDSTASAPL